MIQERILELVKYGLTTGLVDPADEVYTVNRLLEDSEWTISRMRHLKGRGSACMDTGRGRGEA